jgi:translation initiation factor IF-2
MPARVAASAVASMGRMRRPCHGARRHHHAGARRPARRGDVARARPGRPSCAAAGAPATGGDRGGRAVAGPAGRKRDGVVRRGSSATVTGRFAGDHPPPARGGSPGTTRDRHGAVRRGPPGTVTRRFAGGSPATATRRFAGDHPGPGRHDERRPAPPRPSPGERGASTTAPAPPGREPAGPGGTPGSTRWITGRGRSVSPPPAARWAGDGRGGRRRAGAGAEGFGDPADRTPLLGAARARPGRAAGARRACVTR